FLQVVGPVGPVAGDGAVDESGPGRAERRGPKPETVGRTGSQVLHEYVGAVDEPQQQVPVAGVLDVKLDAFLAPVEPGEVAGLSERRVVVIAGEVAGAGPFDLDDASSEVGQLPGRERRGNGLLQGDDGDAVKGIRH